MPYWRLFYHFTWSTHNREPWIAPAWEADLHRVISAKALDLGAIIHAVGGTEDHIHLVTSVPPQVTLSDFVGQIKGHSSHFVNHVLSLDFHFSWQSEYGVVSFGEKQLPFVVAYVTGQREHHAAQSTRPYLERTSAQPAGLRP